MNCFSDNTLFKAKSSTNTIDQAPHLPDLAPVDFFLFLHLQWPLRGTRFETSHAILTNSRKKWMVKLNVDVPMYASDYFEGDTVNLYEG